MDGGRAAEPDDEVLGEVGHAGHLVGDDLADRDHGIPAGEEVLVDLDRNRVSHAAAGHRRDLVAAYLAESHQSFPPPVLDDGSERDPIAEQQDGLGGCHRRMRAERRENADLAAGGGQPLVQHPGDLSRPRVQPGVVGRNQEHAFRAGRDQLGGRDLVDDLAELVERDGVRRPAHAAKRCRRRADAKRRKGSLYSIDDRDHLSAGIDRRDIALVVGRRFQRCELAIDHRRAHEVVGPSGKTSGCLVAADVEVHETDVSRGAERIPIRAPEGRARHHDLRFAAHRPANSG